jgi:hypothetical protein
MTQHEFSNALRILISVDHHEVPFLDKASWEKFRDDPFRFMMRANDNMADAVWAVVEKRATRRAS